MLQLKINKLLACSALCSVLTVSAVQAKDIEFNTAKMQAMDKITGKVSEINVPVNGEVIFGSFSVVVRSCHSRPPEETPESFAFVDVVDNYNTENKVNIFKGWMMSSSPALNAVEHPIYDVWLLDCYNNDNKNKKLLSAEELKARDEIAQAVAKNEIVESDNTPEDTIIVEPEKVETEESAAHEPEVLTSEAPVAIEKVDTVVEDGAPKSLLNLGDVPAQSKQSAETAPTDDADVVTNVVNQLKSIENSNPAVETDNITAATEEPSENQPAQLEGTIDELITTESPEGSVTEEDNIEAAAPVINNVVEAPVIEEPREQPLIPMDEIVPHQNIAPIEEQDQSQLIKFDDAEIEEDGFELNDDTLNH